MDFTSFSTYFVPVVILICLLVGYIIKTNPLLNKIPNGYIPTILAVIGIIANIGYSGISKSTWLETIAYGAMMGVASTGFYEAFRNWIERNNTDDNNTNIE